jgi:UDP-N-acetylmuramate dehydrogenase
MDSLHGRGYYSSVATLRDFLEKINIKAKVTWNEPMALHTTFKIGGPAEAFVTPSGPESAALLLVAAREEGIPLFILGGGANILVGDKGIRGIVMDSSGLRSVREGQTLLVAGAGLSIDELCLEALSRGLVGLEDFNGMPGSVGGAVFMNARCYEREMSQVLAWTLAVDDRGRLMRRELGAPNEKRAEWSYKRSPFQAEGQAAGELILEAAFRLEGADDEAVLRKARVMRERRADREAKGHYRLPSAGSVFKNDRSLGAPTGKLLDGLGLRGKRIGDAMVSAWHANIFVNAGSATAADMRELIELARREAREKLGLELESEVLMVGEF